MEDEVPQKLKLIC